jgi:CHAT domain-containing protein
LRLRAVALLLVASAWSGAQQQSTASPSDLYAAARLAFRQGDNSRALALARQKSSPSSDPGLRELFAILEAEIVCRNNNAEAALRLLAQIPPSSNPEARVRRLIASGYARSALSQQREAERDYAAADSLAKSVAPQLRPEIALNRVTPWFRLDDWATAEKYAQQAIDGGRALNQPFVIVDGMVMRATIEMNRQQWELAQRHFAEVSPLAQKIGSHFTESIVIGNVGWCYRQLGDLEEAKNRFVEAEAYAEAHGVLRVQPTWLANIANVYSTQQRFHEALPFAERSVAKARGLKDAGKLAVSLGNLAQVYIELAQYDLASQANQEAMVLRRKSKGDDPLLVINQARLDHAAGRSDIAVASLGNLAQRPELDARIKWQAEAFAASIYQAMSRPGDARRMYEAAIESGDTARGQINRNESYLFAFETNLLRFYDEYINFLLSSGLKSEALAVAERSRARTLREGLGELRRGETAARTFNPAKLARAQDATILCYWLGHDRSWLWVVTASGVETIELPRQDVVEGQISAYRLEILNRSVQLDNAAGLRLYQTLVAPAVPYLRSSRVIVVPHGALTAMNLEAVIVPSPQPHYWLEDVTLSYTPALQLLPAVKPARPTPQRLLVIGNIPAGGSGFPALQRAGAEIDVVASHFAPSQRLILSGAGASPAAYLKSSPSHFDIIHFAAHGTANERVPLDSAVILAGGRLSGDAIVGEQLDAQLVTVSSCNSAGKRSYAGEGLVGLAWAFLRARAQRVIAAQWDVSDAASPALMDVMYREIAKGQDPARALHEAKLAMIRAGGKDARPFNWAPFILYEGR